MCVRAQNKHESIRHLMFGVFGDLAISLSAQFNDALFRKIAALPNDVKDEPYLHLLKNFSINAHIACMVLFTLSLSPPPPSLSLCLLCISLSSSLHSIPRVCVYRCSRSLCCAAQDDDDESDSREYGEGLLWELSRETSPLSPELQALASVALSEVVTRVHPLRPVFVQRCLDGIRTGNSVLPCLTLLSAIIGTQRLLVCSAPVLLLASFFGLELILLIHSDMLID